MNERRIGRIDPMTLYEAATWASQYEPRPTLEAFINRRVGLTHMLAAAAVLWPELRIVDGCLCVGFLFRPDAFAALREAYPGQPHVVEARVNQLRLFDLFTGELRAEPLRQFGELLTETWAAAARPMVPTRQVVTSLDQGERGPTVVLYTR